MAKYCYTDFRDTFLLLRRVRYCKNFQFIDSPASILAHARTRLGIFFFWMVESNTDSKFYRFFHSIKSNEDRKTKNYVCYSAFTKLAWYLQKFKLIIYSNGFFSFIQLTNFFSFLFNRNNIYIWYVCVVCGMYLFAINS